MSSANNGAGDEGWGNAPAARSPSPNAQARSPTGARVESRRSRSRSPARGGDSGRGRRVESCSILASCMSLAHYEISRTDGGINPGNNLHVSGLSSRVDNRELETLFSKMGKVDLLSFATPPNLRLGVEYCCAVIRLRKQRS
jgi:transformer-2 protein